jgi:SAM-dependent methyltransferase
MNRQQRRAEQRQARRGSAGVPASAPAAVMKVCAEATWQQQQGRLDEAVRLFRRALALKPDFGQALNGLGCALLAQGKFDKAAATFRQLVLVMPEVFDDYADFIAVLTQVDPALKDAMARAAADWPQRLSADDLLGADGIAALTGDPLLHTALVSVPVRDIDLERVLTAARAALLGQASDSNGTRPDERLLDLACALARQCFINEYVFEVTPQELEQVERLQAALAARLAGKEPLPPLWPVALACYRPLHAFAHADALIARRWPAPVDAMLTQQLREPREERQYRDAIPRLTAITDALSMRVRAQYEENPYPRWVLTPSRRAPVDVNAHLREQFPAAAFRPLDTAAGVDLLVAGCGTGYQPIALAQLFADVRVLAVDLSLTSLCYAERMRRALEIENIEFAQADILQIAEIGRSFDVVDASGVLHHLADPLAGWRILLALLRPGGFMHVGLYSELGRRDIVAARAYIAEHNYRPSAEDIRRCRQELMTTPLRSITKSYDFFGMSDCRDLLFHVQEERLTIAQIKAFLDENNLTFLGFKLGAAVRARYQSRFPEDRAMTNLDNWQVFEQENPATFASMYQFWLQKA